MSDDESDPEAQGIDALRLLKQGSVGLKQEQHRSGGITSTSGADSAPLVKLLPSQKRSRSLSQDLTDQVRPGNVDEMHRAASGMARAPSVAVNTPSSAAHREARQREIKQHKSAPERYPLLSKELRSCKSAPDLTLPAMAAIRGLQDGTLKVDRQTRLKIAAAARRVLEARELKRRSSQERDSLAQYSCPNPDHISPVAIKSQTLWEKTGQAVPTNDVSQSDLSKRDEREEGNERDPGASPLTDVPESLGTAAAIASGQSSSAAAAKAKANFHRPALSTVSQGGALLSTSHRPFTVTTGLPRFAPGDSAAPGDDSQVAPKLPTTPPRANTPSERTAQRLPISMVLSMNDLFAPSTEHKG